jgi:hypothetical protein
MDIERAARAKAIEILEPFISCYEEVRLIDQSGKKIRAYILAVSVENCTVPLVFAVEVKSLKNDEPGKFRDAVFQAAKYVQAFVPSNECSDLIGLKIDAAFVFSCSQFSLVWEDVRQRRA